MDRYERREARSGSAAQAAEWDARYSERDGARWSGRPNGRLVAEVASLAPGRALDVGCGEGADATWLARRGWTVTAIDVSDGARLLGDEFTVELRAVEPRIDPPPDNPHIADVVLRARRR
jgi:SAM-dependent methyltransferase